MNTTIECIICLDKLSEKPIKTTSCMHIFHEECIDNWIKNNTSCPICRNPLYRNQEILVIRSNRPCLSIILNILFFFIIFFMLTGSICALLLLSPDMNQNFTIRYIALGFITISFICLMLFLFIYHCNLIFN